MAAVTTVTIVHCWSAPRSRSTATLYSFDSRSDTVALDEPLYRRWLLLHGHKFYRPYKTMLFDHEKEKRSLNERIDAAITSLQSQGVDNGVVFMKHMAKHKDFFEFEHDRELGALAYSKDGVRINHQHILLIRNPFDIISSWNAKQSNHAENGDDSSSSSSDSVTLEEVGIVQLLGIYSSITSIPGRDAPIVLDSDLLVSNPSHVLSRLCATLNIPYGNDTAVGGDMLTWPSGPKACDGPWAPYWYEDIHGSSGWSSMSMSAESSRPKYRSVGGHACVDILRASLPSYDYLAGLALCTVEMSKYDPGSKIFEDPRNADVLCWIGTPDKGRVVPRDIAGVSPFDSAVQGGDAVWEGLRVYNGRILSLERHLKRLFNSARAMGFTNVHSKESVIEAIFRTLAANGMRNHTHIRLTLSRGKKWGSSMNPKFNVYGTTLIVLPEWKPVEVRTMPIFR